MYSAFRDQGMKVIRTGECDGCHGQEGRALKGRSDDRTPVGNNHVPGQVKGPIKSTYRWLSMTLSRYLTSEHNSCTNQGNQGVPIM